MLLPLQSREAARCPPRGQDQVSDREVGVSSPGLRVSVGQSCSGLADRFCKDSLPTFGQVGEGKTECFWEQNEFAMRKLCS